MTRHREATSYRREAGGADRNIPDRDDKSPKQARYVDRWLAVVMSSNLLPRAKLVGYALSRCADWQTGTNCYPSDKTVWGLAGLIRGSEGTPSDEEAARKTVQRGRADLEVAGFIERTGKTRVRNVIDYRLLIPPSWDTGVPTDVDQLGHGSPAVGTRESHVPLTSWDTGVPCALDQLGHGSPAVGTPVSGSWDTGVPQPSKTTSDQESEEEDDERSTTDPEDRVTVVRQILPPSWRALTIQAGDPGLGVLDELQAAGWSARDLRAACESLPVPRKHPTGLLVSHLRQLRGQNPATLTTVGSPNSHPAPVCPHDLDRRVYCRDCEDEKAVPQLVQGVAL